MRTSDRESKISCGRTLCLASVAMIAASICFRVGAEQTEADQGPEPYDFYANTRYPGGKLRPDVEQRTTQYEWVRTWKLVEALRPPREKAVPAGGESRMVTYAAPEGEVLSRDYKVWADGKPVDVYIGNSRNKGRVS